MPREDASHTTAIPSLGQFIRDHAGTIVTCWAEEAGKLPHAHDLSRQELHDHIPELLDVMADALLADAGDQVLGLRDLPLRHALDRLDLGYDLPEMVREYGLLRSVLLDIWHQQHGSVVHPAESRRMHQAVDEAIAVASEHHALQRQRVLTALNRVSDAALGAGTLEEFLRKLLGAIVEAIPAADVAEVFLREADRLVAHSAVGLDEEVAQGFALALGEGFVGTVAALRRPQSLTVASTDPLVRSPWLRKRGTRALHGVPLLLDGEVLGVALVGSCSAFEFSADDLLLFRTITDRAASLIAKARLVQRERAAQDVARQAQAELDALFDGAPLGLAILDPQLRYRRVNQALADMNGLGMPEHLGRTPPEVVPTLPAPVVARLHGVVETGRSVTGLEYTRRPEGPEQHVLGSFFPVRRPDGQGLGMGVALVDITARVRAEREARAQVERLHTVLETIPVGVFITDAAGRIIQTNAAAAQVWGTAPHVELERLGEYRGWWPDSRQRLDAHDWPLARALERGETTVGAVVDILGFDNRRRTILVSASPIRSEGRTLGAVAMIQDVTELRRTESQQRILASLAPLLGSTRDPETCVRLVPRLLVPTLADGCLAHLQDETGARRLVATVHADVHKSQLARQLRRVHGRTGVVPEGLVDRALTHGESALLETVHEQDLAAATRNPEELELLRRLGIQSCLVVPLKARSRVLGALTLVTTAPGRVLDPHDLRVAEEVAARVGAALDNELLHQQAQEALRLRDSFLAVVSHDLRSPLSAIGTSAEVLGRAAERPDLVLRSGEVIQRAVAQMGRLISDLVDVANVEAGRLVVRRVPEDLGAIVTETVGAHRGAAAAGGVELRAQVTQELPPVACDRVRVLQVLSNLLGNALKVTPPGGTITVRAQVVDGVPQLSVADTGPGIAEADQPHIFERYRRGQDARYSGSGLGLAIAKGLVEAHGGRIWFETVAGQGTVFHFTLPLAATGTPP